MDEKIIYIWMINAISFQSCQFNSVTECVSPCGDDTNGVHVRPFVNVRPELNGLLVNHLHHPDHTHRAECLIISST